MAIGISGAAQHQYDKQCGYYRLHALSLRSFQAGYPGVACHNATQQPTYMCRIVYASLHAIREVVEHEEANTREQCFPCFFLNYIAREQCQENAVHAKYSTRCTGAYREVVPRKARSACSNTRKQI